MKIDIDPIRVKAFLEDFEDAEAVGSDEYVVDLYDVSQPVSLDIAVSEKGCSALAALRLCYDEEADGWYLGDSVDDPALIAALLNEAMA